MKAGDPVKEEKLTIGSMGILAIGLVVERLGITSSFCKQTLFQVTELGFTPHQALEFDHAGKTYRVRIRSLNEFTASIILRAIAPFPTMSLSSQSNRSDPDRRGLLLFDFDGTLADTRTIGHAILNDMAREFKFRELPEYQIEEARGMNTRQFISHLGISKWKVPAMARRGLQLLHERIHLVDPISGIPETLATLHGRGERLAILTSNSEANVEAFLTRHNLPYFEFVSCSSKLFGKGREIRRILRKEKLTPGEILYIGDETRDIEAAKETGLRMAAVTWGYNSEEALQALNPHHLVSLPGELLTLTTK